MRSITLENTTSYGTSSNYLIEWVHECNTVHVSASYLGKEVFWDEQAQTWTFDMDDEPVRIGLCPCTGDCLLDDGMARCKPIADGHAAVLTQDFWSDNSLGPIFNNQSFDPINSPECVIPETLSQPTGYNQAYTKYCTNKKMGYGTHRWNQDRSQLHDVDKAIRAQESKLSAYPLLPTPTPGKLKARYSVREPDTTDWDDTYRSATNYTSDWLTMVTDQGCNSMFSVNNWISNHDLRIIPEVELGWLGRPTWHLWTDTQSRKFAIQMDADQVTVKNLLSLPTTYEGGHLMSDGTFFDTATFLFGERVDGYVKKLVRAKYDSAGWQKTVLTLVGATPMLDDAIIVPYDTNHVILMGKYGTRVRMYRVILDGNIATVTLLASLSGFSRVSATRLADHSPLMVVSGSSLMRFYSYNGTELSTVWTASTSQLVESMAYTGDALLLKHVGNLQVYRIDLAAQTKTPEGDLLPTGAGYYTLLPSRLRMVLGVGSGLNVKAYQQMAGEWTGWPTFLQAN